MSLLSNAGEIARSIRQERQRARDSGGYSPIGFELRPTEEAEQEEARRLRSIAARKQSQSDVSSSIPEELTGLSRMGELHRELQWRQLQEIRKKAATQSGSGAGTIPGIVREPMMGLAQLGTDVTSTLVRPFSKDMADYFLESGDVIAAGAEKDREGSPFPWLGRMYAGAVRSLGQAVLFGSAGQAATIASFAATEGNQALKEAEDAGLEGADRLKYAGAKAAVEGAVTAAFGKIGLGGFEGMSTARGIADAVMKKNGKEFLKQVAGESAEELSIEALHALTEAASGVNPEATGKDELTQRFVDTLGQTLMTMGLTKAQQAAARKVMESDIAVESALEDADPILKKAEEVGTLSRREWERIVGKGTPENPMPKGAEARAADVIERARVQREAAEAERQAAARKIAEQQAAIRRVQRTGNEFEYQAQKAVETQNEQEIYRNFYTDPVNAVEWAFRFPEAAEKLAVSKTYRQQDLNAVDPDLPAVDDPAARRSFRDAVRALQGEPLDVQLAIKRGVESELRPGGQWVSIDPSLQVPDNPSVETREAGPWKVVRLRPAEQSQEVQQPQQAESEEVVLDEDGVVDSYPDVDPRLYDPETGRYPPDIEAKMVDDQARALYESLYGEKAPEDISEFTQGVLSLTQPQMPQTPQQPSEPQTDTPLVTVGTTPEPVVRESIEPQPERGGDQNAAIDESVPAPESVPSPPAARKLFDVAEKVRYLNSKGKAFDATVIEELPDDRIRIRVAGAKPSIRVLPKDSDRIERIEPDPISVAAASAGVLESDVRAVLPRIAESNRHEAERWERAKRRLRDMTGLNSSRAGKINDAGRDFSSVKNFDVHARDVAAEFPDVFGDSSEHSVPQKAWEMILEGVQSLPRIDSPEVIRDAVDYVLSRQQQGLRAVPQEAESVADDELWDSDVPQMEPDEAGELAGPEEGDDSFEFGSQAEAAKPASDVLSKADESRRVAESETEQFGFGPSLASASIPPGTGLSAALETQNPEVNRRLQAVRGISKPGFVKSLKETVRQTAVSLMHKVTRPHEHIPASKEFNVYRERFRLLKTIPDTASDETNRRIAAVLGELDDSDLQVMERKLIYENQLAAAESGQPLRFGFTSPTEVKQELEKVNQILALPEAAKIRKALELREDERRDLADQLIQLGLLTQEASDSPSYFHQQVITRLHSEAVANKGQTAKPKKRSFQKKRVADEGGVWGEEYDYNTSFIEAEAEWMTQARVEIAKEQWLQSLPNMMSQLKAEADLEGVDWQTALRKRKNWAAWQPKPGNSFYRAWAIPDRIAEQLESGVWEDAEISIDDLRQVVALGGQREPMILPAPVVEQLESMDKPRPSGYLGQLARSAQKFWKAWTLLNPKRFLPYSLRNITGDVDAVFAGAPSVFSPSLVMDSTKELHRYYSARRLSLSGELRLARDLGVIDSSLSAQEIPELSELPVFGRFKRKGVNPPRDYYSVVGRYNEFRESILRFAAFKHYRKKLADGTLSHYGASRPDVVKSIHAELGLDAAAAHLSRNLVGDYGNLSVAGDWLRNYLIPFWAFQEINLKRTPRFLINAVHAVKESKSPVAAAAAVPLVMSRVAGMYALLWFWNNVGIQALTGEDEEEKLQRFDRQNPHILLPPAPDGSVRVFRSVGTLGDFLEWFGLNSATELTKRYFDGQIDLETLFVEMAKDPANKVIGSLRPDLKALMEIPAGISSFPDAFNPRSAARDELAAGIFGLRDEYLLAKGKILGDGTRPRDQYFGRWLIGISNPKQSALSEIHDLRNAYLEQKGIATPTVLTRSEFTPMRNAVYADDFESFRKARRAYIAKGNSYDDFKRHLQYLDPIASRLNDEREIEFEQEFLNGLQRKKLRIARDYARDLEIHLWQWWKAAEADDSPDVKALNDSEKHIHLMNLVYQATSPSETKARDEAADQLSSRGVSLSEGRRLLTDYWKHRRYSPVLGNGDLSPRLAERMGRLGKILKAEPKNDSADKD